MNTNKCKNKPEAMEIGGGQAYKIYGNGIIKLNKDYSIKQFF